MRSTPIPASMAAALDVLIGTPAGRRVAFFGGICWNLARPGLRCTRRLPNIRALRQSRRSIARVRWSRQTHAALPPDQRGLWTETADDLAARVGELLRPGDVVLVKGSKGAKTSRIVDAIRNLGHRERR